MNNNDFLSVFDVGKILDVSKEVVNTWLRKGKIKYSLAGRLQKIRKDDLLYYLKRIGNSPESMEDFERGIENYLAQKRIWGKQFKTKLRDLEKARR
ncbi:hypothetical protein ES705_18313 [subsurface metagenome]|jgi:excisionase family DNA binding protein